MKKWLSLVLLLVLIVSAFPAQAETWACGNCGSLNTSNYCPNCGQKKPTGLSSDTWTCAWCGKASSGNWCGNCGKKKGTAPYSPTASNEFAYDVYGLAIDKIATRSGPSTSYTGLGTYKMKGEYLRILSSCYDNGGVCWLQVEVTYGGALRRVYTGLKRFDTDTFDLDEVPEERILGYSAKVTKTTKAKYGPGTKYGNYSKLTVQANQKVTINFIENDYAQVQYKDTDGNQVRLWLPLSCLKY